MDGVGRPGRYWGCTRADLRRGGAALLLIVMIAGVAGGISLAAVAGARRTDSSYRRLVEAEDVAEVFMFGQGELSPDDLEELRRIPKAKVGASTIILLSSAASGIDRRNDFGIIVAADAASLAMLRPHHLVGRLPSPGRPEEVVINELVARELDVVPGDTIELVGPTPAAFGCITALECQGVLLNEPIHAVVSGVMRRSSDLDPDAFNGALLFAGPGMLDLAPSGYLRTVTVVDVKLDEGRAGAEAFRAAVEARFPERFGIEVDDPADTGLQGTLDVESRSLLLFALFAGVAGLVATLQGFARHLDGGRDDRRVLASLGFTTSDRVWLVTRTMLLVVVGATVVAVTVAIAGSRFVPVGVARRVEPDPGFDVDLLVLGWGALGIALLLVVAMTALAWRACARDIREPALRSRPAGDRLYSVPIVAAIGMDMAAPRLRQAGAASSVGAILGVVAAVATVSAAVVIAASNDELQTSPERYGEPWDANVALAPDAAQGLAEELAGNGEITALAITPGGSIELGGAEEVLRQVIAVGFDLVKGEMEPVLLDGRAPRTPDEVALGSKLFGQLDVEIGDRVTSGRGGDLLIVGRAIVPIVSGDFPDEGALLTGDGFDRHAALDIQGEESEVAVGFDVLHPDELDVVLDRKLGPAVTLAGAPARTPSDVTSLAGMSRLPVAVGVFTAVLAMAALSHSLLVAVRRRRRDLATLRALGLQRRQTALTVVCASLTVLIVGLVLGVPLGVAAGRLVWHGIARSIHVVPSASVPVDALALLAALSILTILIAAIWPVVRVARLRVPDALRAP